MAGFERKVKKLLKDHQFELVRQPRGSHEIWSNGTVTVSVPAKIRKRQTAVAILKQAEIPSKI